MSPGQWSVVEEVNVANAMAVALMSSDPKGRFVWIVGTRAGIPGLPPTVGSPQVMDTRTFAVSPFHVRWSAAAVFAGDGKTMAMANFWDSIVSLYDLPTGAVTQLSVGSPSMIATTSDPTKVFAANYGSLFSIDLAAKTVSAPLTSPRIASWMTGSGDMLYIAGAIDPGIAVINAKDWRDANIHIPLSDSPRFAVVSPDGRFLVASYKVQRGSSESTCDRTLFAIR